jgi:K+-transporting ATPase ATPase B chain
MNKKTFTLFDPALVVPALREAFRKLSPAVQWRNPVMFVVYVGSILTTLLAIQALGAKVKRRPASLSPSRCGCGSRCSSPTLRKHWPKAAARPRPPLRGSSETWAKKLQAPHYGGPMALVQGGDLRKGDVVVVEAGDIGQSVIPPTAK